MPIINHGLNNNKAYHVLRFTQTGDPDPMISTIATGWDSGTEDLLLNAIGVADAFVLGPWAQGQDSYRFIGIRSLGQDASGDLFEAEQAYDVQGPVNGVSIPPNVSVLVRKKTGLAGRRFRGRMFLPGLIATANIDENGNILTAQLGAFQDSFDDWFTALSTSTPDRTPFILHNDNSLATPMTGFIVEPMVATQRRRLR